MDKSLYGKGKFKCHMRLDDIAIKINGLSAIVKFFKFHQEKLESRLFNRYSKRNLTIQITNPGNLLSDHFVAEKLIKKSSTCMSSVCPLFYHSS